MLKRLRAFFAPQDMTSGNILQLIIRFSVPLILGNFAQQLYSTVDSIIVGRVVPGGLAAIGATFPIINFSILFFAAIATGAGVMVAQYFGARDQENLAKTVGNTLMVILFATIILTGILIPLARPFLRIINTPADILDQATQYLQISFLGFLGAAYFNIGSGILRGIGDSFTPLLFLLISTILNTVLDIIFVWYFFWGVAGAAWATIISQAISAILCLIQIYRSPAIRRLEKKDIKPDFIFLKKLIRLGIPAGITQGIFSLAMLLVQNLVNLMGTVIVEVNTIVIRLDGFVMMPSQTFGMVATTFIGQNIGARKINRVKAGAKKVSQVALAVAAFLSLLLFLFGKQAFRLFTTDPYVIDIAYKMMLILIPGYIAFSQTSSLGGVMRGAGDTITPMWIAIFSTILFRVPLAYLLAHLTKSEVWPHGHPYTVNIALLIGWLLASVLTIIYYRKGNWRDKSVV